MRAIRSIRVVATGLLLIAVALVGISVTSSDEADAAVTHTSYVTFNIAGANSTWGPNPLARIRNAQLVVWYAAAHEPSAIAVQEVCDNTNSSVTDAKEYLMWELAQRGYTYYGYSTKVLASLSCVQGTWIFAKGTRVSSDYEILPGNAERENLLRVIQRTGTRSREARSTTRLANSQSMQPRAEPYEPAEARTQITTCCTRPSTGTTRPDRLWGAENRPVLLAARIL